MIKTSRDTHSTRCLTKLKQLAQCREKRAEIVRLKKLVRRLQHYRQSVLIILQQSRHSEQVGSKDLNTIINVYQGLTTALIAL